MGTELDDIEADGEKEIKEAEETDCRFSWWQRWRSWEFGVRARLVNKNRNDTLRLDYYR
jgi:hypothetical protein